MSITTHDESLSLSLARGRWHAARQRFPQTLDGRIPQRRSRHHIEVIAAGTRFHHGHHGPTVMTEWWEQEAYGLPIDVERDRMARRADAATLRYAADEFLRMHGTPIPLLGDDGVADVDVRPLEHLRLMGTDDVSWQGIVYTSDTSHRAAETDTKVRWPAIRTRVHRSKRSDQTATVTLWDGREWTVTACATLLPDTPTSGRRMIGNGAWEPYTRRTKAARAAARAADIARKASTTEHVATIDLLTVRAHEIAATLREGEARTLVTGQLRARVKRVKASRFDVRVSAGGHALVRTSRASATAAADAIAHALTTA